MFYYPSNLPRNIRHLVAVLILILAPTHMWAQNPALQPVLHSNKPYGEVHVPIVLKNNTILCKVVVEGRQFPCILDTGSAAVAWDTSLNLPGHYTKSTNLLLDGSGHSMKTEEVILSSLQLGSYEVRDLFSQAINPSQETTGNRQKGYRFLLGDAAFSQVVLTIDTQKKELIIRRPNYDFSQQPHDTEAFIADITYANMTNPAETVGVPTLQGTIQGCAAHILLDTGWGAEEIGIASAFRNAVPALSQMPTGKVTRSVVAGSSEWDCLPAVDFALGSRDAPWQRPAILMSAWALFPEQAVVGLDVLSHYRITIDYPRKKILFEPYLNQPDTQRKKNSYVTVTWNGKTYKVPNGGTLKIDPDPSDATHPPQKR